MEGFDSAEEMSGGFHDREKKRRQAKCSRVAARPVEEEEEKEESVSFLKSCEGRLLLLLLRILFVCTGEEVVLVRKGSSPGPLDGEKTRWRA